MNTVTQQKLDQAGELTRSDIADVLVSIGKPGEKRTEKQQAIKELCEAKNTGMGLGGHSVAETLSDWVQY